MNVNGKQMQSTQALSSLDRLPFRSLNCMASRVTLIVALILLTYSFLIALPVEAQELTFGGYEVVESQVEEAVEEQVVDELVDQVTDQAEADLSEVVDEVVTDVVQDVVQDEVEDQLTFGGLGVDNQVEDQVTEQVEQQVEEQLTETTEDVVQEQVLDTTEQVVEDQVVDTAEQVAEEQVVTAAEEIVTDAVADNLEQSVEISVQDSVEAETEAAVMASVEEATTLQVEASAVAQAEQAVDSAIEAQIADSTVAAVDQSVESNIAGNVDTVIEDSVSEQVADTAEANAESQVAESVVAASEDSVAAALETQVSDTLGETAEATALVATQDLLEAEIDKLVDDIESDLDVDARRIDRGQWLVMAEPSVFDELANEGYLFDTFTELPGLGLRLAQVAAPASFDISSAREGIIDVVGSDRAEVDLNHIYTAGAPETLTGDAGISPRDAMSFPDDMGDLNITIGIVDSAVDTSHASLAKATITTQNFVENPASLPNFHGTAIASIFSANDDALQGLVPKAHIYAAAVFERDAEQGEIASTVSLVRAIDWLLSENVDAINLSLAGPPNRLLEVALKRVAQRKVMVLAAAGNGGPMARPMYPAAYDSVVAVTAVDARGRAFRLANRGDYLDLAAPGVNVRHALAGGGYAASSGTSFAVPFAATAAVRLMHREPGADVLARLYASATDLGAPGRDDVYGYGLLMP